ncbi:2-polyprenyl-6-methoxyphenol hydroxylase-like FAD-dependent oxidoreductase [Cupriavidus metallidurans]|jgi:2-polyprenyl-6-methoxyphenol hydroxylase-like FAD-dependent oxidoreductase|uniref:Monooxygenase, FAD/NAD(P)-binding domain protein n=1 Tax=Cupriavidus metallidurans (strain ATCC 43123 / DSM 2839 / NBRC 102507 / CH34) TaxID=266264 RepID=Q1LGS7_CUPMC|nr:FAD-dependent monooxygenase [Cupriavidus metallidurans]ABF10649.1 putative monooxygenase, FAD/NAD(P)-binding domain protein [Cupriavidus metallidurans CH34]AVA35141.1 monooxygenase [Cupriavidus metallidurans]KWW34295.1 putative tryptophan hydroxylase VioD [Cupriavidus metallidurans]MDE4921262.1 FAD-dependent monooxygenase [Cupriavidus metallidurans]QGS31883.1 monooxygenase [Cupriavidus metallidurans]
MKVAIIGGGPSGLFLSILLKERMAQVDIDVFEQNPEDATFGFGVVLADTGLSNLRAASPIVVDRLAKAMRFNDQHSIVSHEHPIVMRKPGAGGGAIPRISLLSVLQQRAKELGVRVTYNKRIADFDALDADLVVGADGIGSQLRTANEAAFGTTRRTLTNHFAWFGVAKPFASPALVFRKYEGGYFVAHYYPYSDSMSTFVAECDHQTWVDFGMEDMSAEARQALFETVFAPELTGHGLVSNNSIWRQFPVILNANWHVGKQVLIGDALTSAHFSIGSGTRIAMEDAMALADAIVTHPDDVPAALEQYEAVRKPEKAKLISASEASYNWYERIREWMDLPTPHEFVFRFMTRTGRIDAERLRAQFPALMAELAAGGVAAVAAEGQS